MIPIRTTLSTRRHALVVSAAIVALIAAVVLAHGAPTQEHMGGMAGMDDSHSEQSAVVTMCLAIVEVGGIGAVLLGGWLLVRRRVADSRRDLGAPLLSTSTQPRPYVPRARAGPSLLQVYRL